MESPTKQVYWKDKFDGACVTIDASTFDPAIHSETPWDESKKAEKPKKAEK